MRCCPKLKEYLNPLVIIACTIFVGTTLLSVYAYKGIPLFKGPVLEATSYIYITIFGVCIFKEKLNPKKIVALLLIVGGILVYSRDITKSEIINCFLRRYNRIGGKFAMDKENKVYIRRQLGASPEGNRTGNISR